MPNYQAIRFLPFNKPTDIRSSSRRHRPFEDHDLGLEIFVKGLPQKMRRRRSTNSGAYNSNGDAFAITRRISHYKDPA